MDVSRAFTEIKYPSEKHMEWMLGVGGGKGETLGREGEYSNCCVLLKDTSRENEEGHFHYSNESFTVAVQ